MAFAIFSPSANLPSGRLGYVLVIGWTLALAAIVGVPFLIHSPTLGDDLTRWTVRLALAFYSGAAALMLRLRSEEWRGPSERGRLARLCWSLAWLAYLVHLGMAFHYYHGWSHADALRHTEEVSGFGPGIFVSHLFTLVWTLDVLTWWVRPQTYADRPRWVPRLLHGFMVFIIFCATVVYEAGFIRWAGVGLLAGLAVLFCLRPRRESAWSAR
jgi:hypothetical protein